MKLFKPVALFCFILLLSAFTADRSSFELAQKNFPRVGDAYDRKEELILMKCRSKEVSEDFSDIYIRVFKEESIMEVWAVGLNGKYVKFNECKVYAMSGRLGPKRKYGDCQVPEGFYHINDFNPNSSYHLSLGINYPNQSDLKLTDAANPGNDIYIHGGQASAGCMAMSNYYIEDLYIYAVKARNQGQTKIPVHIFPFRMTAANLKAHLEDPELKKHAAFWNNIAEGYNFFERHNRPADFYVDAQGRYRFSDPRAVTANAK